MEKTPIATISLKDLRFKTLLTLIAVIFIALSSLAQDEVFPAKELDDSKYNIILLDVDTLPSLNIPRSGHTALFINGEIMVFGGHTDAFIPTPTAEYFRDGQWHTVTLAYTHDAAAVIPLRSGKVFLGGGFKESLGIGQLFSMEIYDPSVHKSEAFGCLDHKRAYANALEMSDGEIVVSGNWHADDAIEKFSDVYNSKETNAKKVKNASIARVKPYILRISNDDAIIFSSLDNEHRAINAGVIDCLKSPAYIEPFLETWAPLQTINVQRSYNQFIGDESQGLYQWLLPVYNSQTNEIAIARVAGPNDGQDKASFSLLSTEQPFPLNIGGQDIVYTSLICDRERQTAYLIANNTETNLFVIAFQYNSEEPVHLTIYQTEPQQIIAESSCPVLTPEGDIIFTGGNLDNNFISSKSVFSILLGNGFGFNEACEDALVLDSYKKHPLWLWIVISSLIMAVIVLICLIYMKKRKSEVILSSIPNEPSTIGDTSNPDVETTVECHKGNKAEEVEVDNEIESEETNNITKNTENSNTTENSVDKNEPREDILVNLFKRIEKLMEEEQLYLNPNLKTIDVAQILTSNVSYVSAAINSQLGCSFTQYLTNYRVSYAQKLILESPENKLTTISSHSGFATDSTFFRAFRNITGMTPKEWLAANGKSTNTQF